MYMEIETASARKCPRNYWKPDGGEGIKIVVFKIFKTASTTAESCTASSGRLRSCIILFSSCDGVLYDPTFTDGLGINCFQRLLPLAQRTAERQTDNHTLGLRVTGEAVFTSSEPAAIAPWRSPPSACIIVLRAKPFRIFRYARGRPAGQQARYLDERNEK